MLCSYSY